MRETGAGRRIGNANEVLAVRTLNLSAGMARVAFQRLVAVGAIELEIGAHKLALMLARTRGKKSI